MNPRSRQKAWANNHKASCLLSQSDIHFCLLWARHCARCRDLTGVGGTAPAPVGSVVVLGYSRCHTGEEGGHGSGHCRESFLETVVSVELNSLQTRHEPLRRPSCIYSSLQPYQAETVIPTLQMSKWDPRGEFTGPQSQQACGRAAVCRDS